MASGINKIIMCPICHKTMTAPIVMCIDKGHSMCGACVDDESLCSQCMGPIGKTRNLQLEQLIATLPTDLKTSCVYASKGCKYILSPQEKAAHEAECRNRNLECEGKKFAGWNCEWSGNYADLEQHFKDVHTNDCLNFKLDNKEVEIDLNKDHRNVGIVSFFNGTQYFWYKHMVDVAEQKVYWTFQFVGPQKQAQGYFYEFEIINGLRKLKVTEICDNDIVGARNMVENENCVVLSFKTLRNFLNEKGKLTIKYRVMHVRKAETSR